MIAKVLLVILVKSYLYKTNEATNVVNPKLSDYPYVARINAVKTNGEKDIVISGGIVANRWILTSARPFYESGQLAVNIQSSYATARTVVFSDLQEKHYITSFHPHPRYDHTRQTNGLAMLNVYTDLLIGRFEFTGLLNLPVDTFYLYNLETKVAGWKDIFTPDDEQQLKAGKNLKQHPATECPADGIIKVTVEENHSLKDDDSGGYIGDIGSPAVVDSVQNKTIAAVVLYVNTAERCAVTTKVLPHRTWIENVMMEPQGAKDAEVGQGLAKMPDFGFVARLTLIPEASGQQPEITSGAVINPYWILAMASIFIDGDSGTLKALKLIQSYAVAGAAVYTERLTKHYFINVEVANNFNPNNSNEFALIKVNGDLTEGGVIPLELPWTTAERVFPNQVTVAIWEGNFLKVSSALTTLCPEQFNHTNGVCLLPVVGNVPQTVNTPTRRVQTELDKVKEIAVVFESTASKIWAGNAQWTHFTNTIKRFYGVPKLLGLLGMITIKTQFDRTGPESLMADRYRADYKNFPYAARIHAQMMGFDLGMQVAWEVGYKVCTGSVIAEFWVITAAHCMFMAHAHGHRYMRTSGSYVNVGMSSVAPKPLKRPDPRPRYDHVTNEPIEDFVYHPRYAPHSDDKYHEHDIGLVRTKGSLVGINGYYGVSIIPLSSDSFYHDKIMGKMVTWGAFWNTSKFSKNPMFPDKYRVEDELTEELLSAQVTIFENKDCQFPDDDRILCATNNDIATFVADSGAPLEYLRQLVGVQIGVDERNSSRKRFVAVHTYYSWILEKIGGSQPGIIPHFPFYAKLSLAISKFQPGYSTFESAPNYYECSGAVIADRWILTVAQCLRSPYTGYLNKNISASTAKVGWARDGKQFKTVRLSEYYVNPEYVWKSGRGDLALLKTVESVDSWKIQTSIQKSAISIKAAMVAWTRDETIVALRPMLQTVKYELGIENCQANIDAADLSKYKLTPDWNDCITAIQDNHLMEPIHPVEAGTPVVRGIILESLVWQNLKGNQYLGERIFYHKDWINAIVYSGGKDHLNHTLTYACNELDMEYYDFLMKPVYYDCLDKPADHCK